MGVYVQIKYMAMPCEFFCFDFYFITACGAILFAVITCKTTSCSMGWQHGQAAWAGSMGRQHGQAAWAGSMGKRLVYLS